ncbi:MAG: tetratricopeptide repeat protein, partial [Stackebrandtia sp.]
PGAGLARGHLRVLRQQVSVPDEVLPDAESDRPRPPRPAQLPADIAGFVGRDAYLDQLDRIMVEGHDPSSTAAVIVALAGDAGVGKSTLAMHWAHRVADKFTDGQLYADLRGFDPSGEAANPAETVREFLDALGVSPERVPAGVQAQAALYRSLLAERRMLIVLDNARDVDQVRILLPGAPACLALVTSRNRIPGLLVADAARPLTLDLMGDAEARELLSLRIGADRVLAEPAAVDEIIDVCAGLPLALAVVAARVAARPDFPLAELANQLSRAEHRLDTLSGGDKVTDLRNVFSWSYRALSPDASRLFRLLSLHPGPDVAAPAAASAAGVPIKKVTPLLAELSRLHLIGEHNYHRYAFHDLLRVYADELAHEHDSDDNRHEARRRMLDHYLHSAYAMDLLLIPHRDRVELPEPCPGVTPELPTDREHALDWFKAECTALKASVHRAVDAGFDRHAWQLSLITGTFYDRQGLWRDWLPTQETALRAAQRLGDRTGEAYTCLHLATSHLRLRRIDEAFDLGRRALDIFENVGHQRGAALAHHILGLLLDRQERFRDALVHDWQAHNLYRAVGHRFGQARELNSIGWHHALLGDFRRTLVYCEQAVAIQQDVDDLYGQAASWDSLGFAHHRLGRHRQAITCYQNALDLCHRIDDRYSKAITLGRLGDAYRGAGDLADAHDAWREAVGILDDLGNPEADQIRAKLQEG